jgi:hypothetical protein
MENTATLNDSIIAAVASLTPEEVEKTLEFISALKGENNDEQAI